MKKNKKYISCRIEYLFKLYAFMTLVVSILIFIKSCPFIETIGKAMLGPTIMFIIIRPVLGLTFTQKSMSTCRFYLPYKYIKRMEIDEYNQKLIIIYTYNDFLNRKSKKEYKYAINVNNYKTTLSELIACFPENIEKSNI